MIVPVIAEHAAELGLYALCDTLKSDVPPRLVASFYFDTAEIWTYEVTEESLFAAADWAAAGAARVLRLLAAPDTASRTPGPQCSWCPKLDDCADGAEHVVLGSLPAHPSSAGSAETPVALLAS